MDKVNRNIEIIQKEVKDSVTDLLLENGYSLVNEDKYSDNQALLLQWTNKDSYHTFQLRWDIRERWFDLGEFNRIDNLNYIESTHIGLFPYSVTGVLFRDCYNAKYTEKIKLKIKEKLSTTKHTLH